MGKALKDNLGWVEGWSMQPLGLRKEATEKQNAQNHDNRDDDNFDEAHY